MSMAMTSVKVSVTFTSWQYFTILIKDSIAGSPDFWCTYVYCLVLQRREDRVATLQTVDTLEDDGEDVVEDDDETDGGYDDEDYGKDDDQDDDDDMDEEYGVDGVGECCWESLLWPMEDFYEEKEFKKLVQKEDDEWESLHDRFNSPFVHLKSIQPMLKKIFKENSFVDLPSMYIKLIVNLLKHYTHYTGRDDQELEDYFKYSFDKLTDSSVPLNQKRTMLQKSRLKKKMIEFLKKNYSENEQWKFPKRRDIIE